MNWLIKNATTVDQTEQMDVRIENGIITETGTNLENKGEKEFDANGLVISPGFIDGLEGTPNELKLKYLADNEFSELTGQDLKDAIASRIKEKDQSLVGQMDSEGTTPRRITDLLGSLCDLTSGSGDKGTPIVLVQGYFDNYTHD